MRPQLNSQSLTPDTLTSTIATQQEVIARDDTSSGHGSSLTSQELLVERHDKRKWRNKCGDDDDEDEDDDDDDCTSSNSPTKTSQTSQYWPQPTSMNTSIAKSITSTNIITTTSATSESITRSTATLATNSSSSQLSSSTSSATSTVGLQGQQTNPDNSHDHDDNNNDVKIALGVVGGLFGIFLLLILSWAIIRRRRRDHSPTGGFPKDADLESHVTVDLRIHTPRSGPHDPASSSDALSGYTVPITASSNVRGLGHIVVDSAAGSVSMSTAPGSAHAGVYPAAQRTANGPSPATSHASFRDAQGARYPAHSEAHHPLTYPPVRSPQASARAPACPPLPPPLQICAPPIPSGLDIPPTSDLDGQPPPPRYPEATATSPASRDLSPTSPVVVSPLSATSGHEGFVHPLSEPLYHAQQQQRESKGPQRPGYEGYEPSTTPEVVSPICQLGQTSASPPEYDDSAETARSGDSNNHHILAGRRPSHEDGEKQALPQAMYRY
ncbi:hypothetical protein F5B22DRAFT_406644 [Xylaria bambusicola]|uniref:uncharacterized protein n=1 Tax=Xylaria bambusicola TaxID=326684 RepID=UPI00200850EC|nr:uncharacterized protein F5B22DRAFT_406644 [Xylaria bambusicola]KAI0523635.1 hypothetical protein F5B22DRAFT_406644 [Xylaria bambusicola]